MKKKKKLITSALPYINGSKHLGNLVGSILPADICARYFRQQGNEVLFICGTDEHGAPAEIGAQNNSTPIKDYCDINYNLQKEIYESFNISFDFFGRTSSSIHHEFTKEVFSILDKKGYIFSKKIKQYYSENDKRFLPDRYIKGECPNCSYKHARGDQCDYCGSLINSIDLINPHSVLSYNSKLFLKNSYHLFFDLSKLEKKLYTWIKNFINWPSVVKGIIKKWFKEGLHPRCITRDLSWGVHVNKLDFENKVFYVWFDAILGYISITKEWSITQNNVDLWKDWWKNFNNVELIQFMAKDNVPFHITLWPAIIIAIEEDFILPKYIKGVNWLTYEGDKFSTSNKRGIFTDQALKLFPVDYWRYTLFCMIPENNDTNFSFNNMADIINKDLADNLGNFINRLIVFISKKFHGVLTAGFFVERELECFFEKKIFIFDYHMQKFEFRKAGVNIRVMWAKGNEYFTKSKPWYVIKHDRSNALNIIKNCLWLLYIYSCILAPIIPNIAKEIRNILSIDSKSMWIPAKDAVTLRDWLHSQIIIKQSQGNIINKISKETVKLLTKKFSGV